MKFSAQYVCPRRGLVGLEAPDPERIGQAAKIARSLSIERLLLPVLEEALLKPPKAKVRFLDGLIRAMDRVAEAGLTAWLIAPAQKVLGLDWAAPYLVQGSRDPGAGPVFVDGAIRHLRPYDWWKDPSIIERRLKVFRELVKAVQGHPALTGWVILDRAAEWARPEPQAADLVIRLFQAEIRERDELANTWMGVGWSELLEPEISRFLAPHVEGIRIAGLETWPSGPQVGPVPSNPGLLAAYLGTVGKWLFGGEIDVEVGGGTGEEEQDPDALLEAAKRLGEQGLHGAAWVNLADPEPGHRTDPPWSVRPDLERSGLMDHGLEPKPWVEGWIRELLADRAGKGAMDFIDISADEYLENPGMHLFRLWEHFRTWT
jgi:hypothetical protein